MKTYKCLRCKKVFGQKCHYNYHVNMRKKPCVKVTELPNSIYVKCLHCNKKYKTLYELSAHYSQCSVILEGAQNFKIVQKIAQKSKNVQHKCMTCDRIYTRKSSLTRHNKVQCKQKN